MHVTKERRRSLLITIILVAGASIGWAQQPPAKADEPRRIGAALPWLWSDADRALARLDSDAAAERLKASRVDAEQRDTLLNSSIASKNSRATTDDRWVDVIDGRRHPELFFPTQLFEQVVVLGFVVEDPWRDVWAEGVKAAGLPSDFWPRLHEISAEYIEDLQRHRTAALMSRPTARRGSARVVDAVDTSRHVEVASSLRPLLCRERFEALTKARAAFGPALDRFMYERVAPERFDYIDDRHDVVVLQSEARGCR